MAAVGAVEQLVEVLSNCVMVQERVRADLLGGVELLRSELDLLRNSLLSSGDSTNNSIREFNRRARDLVYEAEDVIDSLVAARALRRNLGGGFRWPWRDSGEGDLKESIRRIGMLNHLMGAERNSAKGDRSGGGEITEKVPGNLSFDPVGMDGDAERLRQSLVGGQSKSPVIGICGVAGVGKTTLAKLVYDDPLVVDHFDTRIWCHLGHHFQPRQILETILFSLASSVLSKKEIAAMDTMEMLGQLYKAQTERRYLIVLDDVWSSDNLDNLLVGFSRDDGRGSRILVTTRSCSAHNSFTESVLHMHLLSDEISWEVLKLRLQLVDDPVNPEIVKVGRQIAGLCQGLPLALSVVGRALRTKRRDLKEWERVLLVLSRNQKPEPPIPDWLAFSYNQLPSRLKQCFLYLGVFPPDQPIQVQVLCSLWIAEGFISARGLKEEETAMEAAEGYLEELVDRSLVIVPEQKKLSTSRKFKSCMLHDIIRLLCISKAKEEEFCEVVSGNRHKIPNSTRRLSVWSNSADSLFNIPESKRIRSILFFDTNESLPRTQAGEFSDLKKSERTRVLNFDGVDFRVKKMPKGIQKLIYLRHLSFHGCYLQELPSSFSNFPLLETLDLRVILSCVMTIANVLWMISSLRHLFLPLAFRVDKKEKLKVDTLIKLETLENFNAGLCDADDLLQLENLRVLKASVDGDTMDLKNVISCLKRNRFLCHSSLLVKKFDAYSKERLLHVAALLECNALRGLNIEGHLGVIPRHQGIGSNFTSMVFDGSEFTEDPMPILGKLPNLRKLVLCNDAFLGQKMVCSESDFLRLESLKLATLQHLEKLETEGAMPNLIVITIDQCDKLVRLTCGLSEITTLRKFVIGSMPKEFGDIVNEMNKERKDLGNGEVAVTFYDF